LWGLDIVWWIDNMDLLKEDISALLKEWEVLRDQGTSQSNKTMYKYWLQVVKKSQELLDMLENGWDNDISEVQQQIADIKWFLEKAKSNSSN
jgi:hypothetical protein